MSIEAAITHSNTLFLSIRDRLQITIKSTLFFSQFTGHLSGLGETDEFMRCNKSNRQKSLNCGPNTLKSLFWGIF